MKRFTLKSGVLLVMILLIGSMISLAEEDVQTSGNRIFLHTGSPLILSGDKILPLDPNNLDVAATVINSRTLVPIRALSEYFGAVVSYNQAEKQAIIEYQGKRYIFPINEKKYIAVNGTEQKTVLMDTNSMILNNRTMVPLRIICEDVLGKKVSYQDRVIAVGDSEINLSQNQELLKDVKLRIGSAVKAGSLSELKKVFYSTSNLPVYTSLPLEEAQKEAEMDNAAPQPATAGEESPSSATSDSGYSTTNTQVAGIDEADIVKTDGKYIYIAGNNAVRIVGADQGKLSDDAAIRLADDKYVQEIYIDGSRLVVLGNKSQQYGIMPFEATTTTDSVEGMKIMPPYIPSKNYAFMDIYDITNPERPVYLKGHEMEGSYQSSRKNGEIVYMITNTYLYGDILLPQMRDSVVSREPVSMRLDDIMIMPGGYRAPGYIVLSAVNINDKEKTVVEAITASGYITYMNDSSLYLTSNDYNGSTEITKFNVDGMNIGYAGTGSVKGNVLNQFSMDEYQDYLRVATTDWENHNSLYILDDSMNIYSSINDLAKGERIYSVRFMGDKGYIVTFRNIDPLFVFDLSDPKNPKLTGELKVPGFSNYLHPVGEDLILGIGAETFEIYQKDANGNEIVIGNRQGGIKFSLFDVSDMGKPKEVANYVIGSSGSYTEAFYNHKAVMFDPEQETFALDASIVNDLKGYEYKQVAVVMNYNDDQLQLKGVLDSKIPEIYGKYIPYGRRVIFINDELYYIQDGYISSYNYNNLAPIDSLMLK